MYLQRDIDVMGWSWRNGVLSSQRLAEPMWLFLYVSVAECVCHWCCNGSEPSIPL